MSQIYKFTTSKEGSLLLFIKQCPLGYIPGNDFHDKTLDVLVKNLKYFLYEKFIKLFCNVPKENILLC